MNEGERGDEEGNGIIIININYEHTLLLSPSLHSSHPSTLCGPSVQADVLPQILSPD